MERELELCQNGYKLHKEIKELKEAKEKLQNQFKEAVELEKKKLAEVDHQLKENEELLRAGKVQEVQDRSNRIKEFQKVEEKRLDELELERKKLDEKETELNKAFLQFHHHLHLCIDCRHSLEKCGCDWCRWMIRGIGKQDKYGIYG